MRNREQEKIRKKELYDYRKENGICTRCGKNHATDGKTLCTECSEKMNAIQKRNVKEKYYYAKENGLCVSCNQNQALFDSVFCKECLENARAYKKKRYEHRKETGICTLCGKNPAVDGKLKCQDCLDKSNENRNHEKTRQYAIETYYWRKEHNLCPQCGKNKPFNHFVLCEECIYKNTVRSIGKELTPEQRERHNQNNRDRKQYREEHGLCKNCGKPLTDLKYKNCIECRNKRHKEQAKRIDPFRKRYKEAGTCLNCGKPRMDGKMYCAECYQKRCESMAYARTFVDRETMKERMRL